MKEKSKETWRKVGRVATYVAAGAAAGVPGVIALRSSYVSKEASENSLKASKMQLNYTSKIYADTCKRGHEKHETNVGDNKYFDWRSGYDDEE